MGLETFTQQFKQDYILDEMEINFKKPVFIQDDLIISKIQKNSETDFTISIQTTEKESALIKIKFKNK